MKRNLNHKNYNPVKSALAIGVAIILMLMGSCKKVVDVKSTRAVAEVNMWNKLEDTRAALLGIYGLTRAAMVENNAHWIYGDVRGKQFVSPTRQDLKAVIDNRLTASYKTLDQLSNWRRWYAVINAANIFLERVRDVKKADLRYTASNMEIDIAQARVLRAFAYFYMVRIWGNVPLIISSHDGSFENRAQNSGAEVLAWAEKEILGVVNVLPNKYGENDPKQPGLYYGENHGRWTGSLVRRISAYAVLAHIAAWQGDYIKVASNATKVINEIGSAEITLTDVNSLTSSNGFFSSKRQGHLLGFNSVYEHGEGGMSGHIEELTLAFPFVNKAIPDIYMSKDSILNTFNEKKDTRFGLDTLGRPTTDRYFYNFDGRYPIFSKIKVIMAGSASTSTTDAKFSFFSSIALFTRLEDIYLLRAEASSVLGDRQGAINDLNTIRSSRGLPNYSEVTNGLVIDAIFKERKRELIGEGHYWFDQVRYNKIRQNNSVFTELIKTGGIYWPVSEELLQQNKLLTQNQYWK
ncbi:RagB/SusD family nutrient uptake outer membrane protein [Pedobacter ginsengisoli]|uniref:RagB/SusD family nutrient uptake outer membrane protein n=1 Tax=Pedobacter ginsengisoli TaxID=363852 RepID=A0A2D1U6F7_9SPHI|nr:RagB/SusD family nutrient uptake outer membrane protein [Pedobacter ginsengisoli]ATP57178.1 RagB/SusD family nutrient uptake outer membrane protein [Pedobacter ginsengisoli]